jgi:tetratricopeptide (TPR) repeat protein
MKNIFTLIIFCFCSFSCPGLGEADEIIAEGSYNMGDGETPTVAESRALLNAKRAALEQAGTYVESYTKVRNFQLTQDQIQVLASGLIEVSILEKKRSVAEEGIRFWVKIKATVTPSRIEELAKNVKERPVEDDHKRLHENYEKLAKEMELLKRELKEAKSGTEKKQIEAKITDSERLFQANEWVEKGRKQYLDKQYDEAINSYTYATALNPNSAVGFSGRCLTYWKKGQYDRAIDDYNRAIRAP